MKPNCGNRLAHPEQDSGLKDQKPLEAERGYSHPSTLASTSVTENIMAPSENAAWSLDGKTNTNSGGRRQTKD